MVVPNARKTELVGYHGERLKIKIHAPPVDGKANDEVIAFFAQIMGVAKSRVSIERGQLSRQKTVKVSGVSSGAAQEIIAALISK